MSPRDPTTGRFLPYRQDGREDDSVIEAMTDLCRAARGSFGLESEAIFVELGEIAGDDETAPSPEDILLACEEEDEVEEEDGPDLEDDIDLEDDLDRESVWVGDDCGDAPRFDYASWLAERDCRQRVKVSEDEAERLSGEAFKPDLEDDVREWPDVFNGGPRREIRGRVHGDRQYSRVAVSRLRRARRAKSAA